MVGIDTIVLTLESSEFAILEPSRFTPHAQQVLNADPRGMGRGKFLSAYCNPLKQDSLEYGYLPILTLYKALRSGGLVTELRIQFSAPKFLKGNNIDEIVEADFRELCEKILDGLLHYKIHIHGGIDTIASARVDVVHFSKNFVLDNFMSARQVILELQKVDVNAWRDVSKTDYSNNGYGFKIHSKYFELAFYDKLAEYRKGKRGQPTFEHDDQLFIDLFDEEALRTHFEIVRMEVRFGNKKAIKQAFERAGINTEELEFKHIFKFSTSKRILQWYLGDLYEHFPKITEATNEGTLELFSNLFVQNPDRQISTLVGAVGLHALIKAAGLRSMKDIVGSKGSAALLRLARRANRELAYSTQKSEVFELLDTQLDNFEPVLLKSFEK
jgi:hypothetical protein